MKKKSRIPIHKSRVNTPVKKNETDCNTHYSTTPSNPSYSKTPSNTTLSSKTTTPSNTTSSSNTPGRELFASNFKKRNIIEKSSSWSVPTCRIRKVFHCGKFSGYWDYSSGSK